MRPHRMLVAMGTAAVLALGGLTASPSDAGDGWGGHHAGGEAVRAWNEVAVTTRASLPGPAGGTPFASSSSVDSTAM